MLFEFHLPFHVVPNRDDRLSEEISGQLAGPLVALEENRRRVGEANAKRDQAVVAFERFWKTHEHSPRGAGHEDEREGFRDELEVEFEDLGNRVDFSPVSDQVEHEVDEVNFLESMDAFQATFDEVDETSIGVDVDARDVSAIFS